MTSVNETRKVPAETRKSRNETEHVFDTITSDETRRVMEIVLYVIINGVLSVLGVVANITNIAVFVKQGFNDSINISLCGLAVSDLCSCLPLMWASICFNPLFRYSDVVRLDTFPVYEVTAGWPHSCFVRITSMITAFITFERCVCIALPFKVKDIITPKRTFISIIAICMLVLAIMSPVFTTVYFGSILNVLRNKTIVSVIYISNNGGIADKCFPANVTAQFFSISTVMFCTVIIIRNLLANSQWRLQVTATASLGNPDSISPRDKRVMKMVITISCIFIACFLPNAINVIIHVHFNEDYSIGGRYKNTFLMSWCFLNVLEVINSSVNILVYYKMSSKFRAGFIKIFCMGRNRRRNILVMVDE